MPYVTTLSKESDGMSVKLTQIYGDMYRICLMNERKALKALAAHALLATTAHYYLCIYKEHMRGLVSLI